MPAVGTAAARWHDHGRPARTDRHPTDIFPLVGDASCTTPTLNFVQDQYVPLYAGPDGAEPAVDESLSAAEAPRYSNGDKTVTIRLKPGLKWSDGKPVVAANVPSTSTC